MGKNFNIDEKLLKDLKDLDTKADQLIQKLKDVAAETHELAKRAQQGDDVLEAVKAGQKLCDTLEKELSVILNTRSLIIKKITG